MAWDYGGNLVVSHNEARSYGWDRANRLTLVSGEMESGEYEDVFYGYDPSGRLIDREGLYDHPEKCYYADGLSPILVKRWDSSLNSGAGGWKSVRTAMILPGVIGHVVAEREAVAWNGSGVAPAFTDRHYHYDLLGNTVLETGTNAAIMARADRSAYGEMVRESNAAGTWESQPSNSSGNWPNAVLGAMNRPRQTTKETDPDTGLRWFWACWCDTGLGGWISPEPLGLDGPNLYWGMRSFASDAYDNDGLLTVILREKHGKWGHEVVCVRDGNDGDGRWCCADLNWGVGWGTVDMACGDNVWKLLDIVHGSPDGKPVEYTYRWIQSTKRQARESCEYAKKYQKTGHLYVFPFVQCRTFASDVARPDIADIRTRALADPMTWVPR